MDSFEREIAYVVDNILKGGATHDEAISIMNTLRTQAQRIDSALANPQTKWNIFEQEKK